MLDYRFNESPPEQPTQKQPESTTSLQPNLKPPGHSQPRSALMQWFYDLPISRKQLIIAGTSLTSILGIIGVGALLSFKGLRTQLVYQAQSEIAVTEINYNIKVNQMGFGFRGQADNAAIIAAAKAQSLTPALQSQVKRILQNEITARKIEYATLVGKDLRIIVNANANRQGEVFNPNNFVTEVFNDPRQIKASAIVNWAELTKESPPLPAGFKNQDALIRYTVTPVRDPETKTIIAALVSGDIVNNKLPIVQGTLKAFQDGYSGVYLRKPTGEFVLATSLDQGTEKSQTLDKAQPNVNLSNTSLLADAAAAQGKSVAGRVKVAGTTYTLAAKALPSVFKEEASGPVPVSTAEPVAVLVRGTPDAEVNGVIAESLSAQLILGLLALLANLGLAVIIARALTKPIQELQRTAQEFTTGERNARATVFARDEVGELAVSFNQLADSIEANSQEIQHQEQLRLQEQEKALRQEAENAQQQKLAKEKLQQRALELLIEVDPLTKGDLTIRANVTDDEIGTIADSYNATIRSLRQIVTQVKAVATQMATTTSTSETSVQELSHEALRQAEEISTALNQIQEMSDSIQAVAQSAAQAEVAVQQANATVAAGDAAMNRTVDGIEAIRDTVAATTTKVKQLSESSRKISKVVNLIGRFAAQTNLLALKASIEAARAGEEGRGFAVLADEVRVLASQSAQATAEIEKLVTDIQAETNALAVAMEAGSEQVATGTRLVDETRQSLNQINAVSAQISELVQAIASAATVQSQTSEAVTQTMTDVAQVANHTSTEAAQVSATFKQLLEVADELQTSVGQFKVN